MMIDRRHRVVVVLPGWERMAIEIDHVDIV
jgi:hypothetical protein